MEGLGLNNLSTVLFVVALISCNRIPAIMLALPIKMLLSRVSTGFRGRVRLLAAAVCKRSGYLGCARLWEVLMILYTGFRRVP